MIGEETQSDGERMIRRMQLSDCAHFQPLCTEVSAGLVLDHELSREVSRAWVVVEDGKPCGFCLTWVVVDEAEIAAMGIVPAARRRGLARRLLEHTLQRLREMGAVRATLEVACTNHSAIGLYQSVGFDRFNVRTGYYRSKNGAAALDAWEMELPLRPVTNRP